MLVLIIWLYLTFGLQIFLNVSAHPTFTESEINHISFPHLKKSSTQINTKKGGETN